MSKTLVQTGTLMPLPCTLCGGRGEHAPSPGNHPYTLPVSADDRLLAHVRSCDTCTAVVASGQEDTARLCYYGQRAWHDMEVEHLDIMMGC